MRKMKLHLIVALGAITLRLFAQTNAESSEPRLFLAQTNHLKATVEDIDYGKREITLKGPEGNSARFAVSEVVKNFPQMKKGDEVNIGYYESLALGIAKPGETLPATSRVEALATRRPGEKPGGAAMAVTDTVATVEDIDREKREVTLKRADGTLMKVEVDPSVGNLQRIKKGDQITATYTEALAISVEGSNAKSDSEPK
jgi:hypothetical protein